MGFALVLIGLLMVITGGRGTYAQFGTLVAGEFTGPIIPPKGQAPNFATWLIALSAVGALGYIQTLQTISRLLMTLIILSIFLSQKGFFAQFQAALKAGPKAPNALTSNSTPAVSQSSSAATISGAITSNQTGVGGSTPATAGQGKFNGWMNYFFGTGTTAAQ